MELRSSLPGVVRGLRSRAHPCLAGDELHGHADRRHPQSVCRGHRRVRELSSPSSRTSGFSKPRPTPPTSCRGDAAHHRRRSGVSPSPSTRRSSSSAPCSGLGSICRWWPASWPSLWSGACFLNEETGLINGFARGVRDRWPGVAHHTGARHAFDHLDDGVAQPRLPDGDLPGRVAGHTADAVRGSRHRRGGPLGQVPLCDTSVAAPHDCCSRR